MSFNKSKTRQTAERYLAQGKIRAAINEYVYIVDNDPADYNTLNVLGDLYARVNEKDEAVDCFKRLAEHYNKQGFSQKAIAVYNKITRLKPDSVEVSAKLAPLYQMKGLVAEARSHYSVLAEYYKNNGKKLEALKIWQQIAELDPNNVEVFFTLAENYLQENYTEEAAEAFAEAGRRFTTQKSYEKAINAYSKALAIHPLDITAIEGLISCQITCGYYDEAVNLIERTLTEHPGNIDLISLLLSCHIELGNYVEAENTVISLVEREPSNYRKFLDVVGLHLKNKDTLAASRMLALCSEHLLVAGHGEELKTWIEEILAQNPEQVEALSLLVRLHAWQREDSELKTALIRMAEASQINDDEDNEKAALAQLVLMAPQEIKFRERLEELGGSDSQVSFGGSESSFAATGEVPTFESFEGLAYNEEETHENTDLGSDKDIDSLTSDMDSGTTEFAFVNPNVPYDPSAETFNGNGYGKNGSNGFASTIKISEDDVVSEPDTAVNARLEKSREAHLLQELESVDFYLVEGYYDLAVQTLDLLETQFGSHAEIDLRRQQLAEKLPPEPAAPEVSPEVSPEVTGENAFIKEAETGTGNEPETAEKIAAAGDEIAAETYEFTSGVSNLETFEPAVEEIAEELPEQPAIAEAYAGQVEEESPAPETLATLATLETPETRGEEVSEAAAFQQEIEDGLAQFEELRSELGFEENESVVDSDYETHYNLGTAYKEMGLFDDAVEEFQEAVKLVTPDDDSRKYLQCCHSLGYCFMEKSMPKLAQLWFEKALQSKNVTIEEKHALSYEIALTFESQGKTKEAAEMYSEIYAIDVTYRDVKDKLGSLQVNK
jgi:tetratricopeptide (TPR) repeat protein